MSAYVVDSSVAVKWVLTEDLAADAQRVLASGLELHAPDIFLLELDNVLCKRVRRGEMTLKDAALNRDVVRCFPVKLSPFRDLLKKAFEVANETKRSMYDTLYLALAVQLKCKMVTADRRFYDEVAATPLAPHVLWIEDAP